jgi:hypothetical protein
VPAVPLAYALILKHDPENWSLVFARVMQN